MIGIAAVEDERFHHGDVAASILRKRALPVRRRFVARQACHEAPVLAGLAIDDAHVGATGGIDFDSSFPFRVGELELGKSSVRHILWRLCLCFYSLLFLI